MTLLEAVPQATTTAVALPTLLLSAEDDPFLS